MPTMKPLKNQLLECLSSRFGELGFKYQATKKTFWRDTPQASHDFQITFANYRHNSGYYFNVGAYVGVEHKALMELREEVNRNIETTKQHSLWGVSTYLINIVGADEMTEWNVFSEEDIPGVCERIMEAFKQVALPYMERFSSLEEILAVTMKDDGTGGLYSPLNTMRAKTAIAAAFVLGKRELYEHLVDQKTEYLKKRGNSWAPNFTSALSEFRSFVGELGKRWPDENVKRR